MNETQTAAVHPLEEMGISREVVQAFDWMGFQNLTSIQQKCIPLMMDGHDIIAIAPTGTGKTLGFGIPMLEYVNLDDSNIQEVVLAPTRELAQQIADELTHLAHFIKGLKIAVIYGGQPFGKQMSALSRKPQVLVATPGRLLDHMQRGNIRLGTVHTMVLDEADEMLKMGFVQDVEKIIESADPNRQLVMFSATTIGIPSSASCVVRYRLRSRLVASMMLSSASGRWSISTLRATTSSIVYGLRE